MASSVEVVVRLRPLNDKEKKHGTLPVISASTNDKTVTVIKGQGSRQARSSYSFDNVFTAFSTQEEVFETTLKPVIKDVLLGYESTVFAYGQTGTGKTHTMEGDLSHPESHGVIPRSAQAIFKALKNPAYQSYTVTCSYLEIYNEELCDLLIDHSAKRKAKLEIMEGKNGPFCRGLSEKEVQSAENVLGLMRNAQQHRKIGETNMNKSSSRSHCIFTIKVEANQRVADGSVLECKGRLHLVDLAGSECAKSANLGKDCPDQAARERERLNINRSLLTLGRVVSMLKEKSTSKKKSNVRIPYRDSKLTRILQESLGGRCKTCIIATLSPSVTAIEESISTLNYAQAANGIVNKPITSSYMTHGTISSSVAVDKLNGTEAGAESEVERWQDMECRLSYMQSQVSEAQAALARKHLQQQELVEKAEQAEASRLEAEQRYADATVEISSLKEEIAQLTARNNTITEQLHQTESTLKKTTVILEATQKTESSLTSEATALLGALRQSISDGELMHKKILENRDAEVERKRAAKVFNTGVAEVLEQIVTSLSEIVAHEENYFSSVSDNAIDNHRKQSDFLKQSLDAIQSMSETVRSTCSALNSNLQGENGLLSSYASSSCSILEGLDATKNAASSGEKEISNKCISMQKQLGDFASHLKTLEATFALSSADLLKSLDKRILGSKEQLMQVVTSAVNALAQAQVESVRAKTNVTAILEQWKNTSEDFATKMGQSAANQREAVRAANHTLSSDMKRHDEINSQLSKQQLYIDENGKSHLIGLNDQKEMLRKQNESFTTSYHRQQQLCENFVANVMTGVQQLVSQQMAIVTKDQETSYSTFVADNNRLAKTNDTAHESAKSIFENIHASRVTLQDNVDAVKENETQVSKFLGETSSTLLKVSEDCRQQQRSAEEMFTQSVKGMEDLNSVDAKTQEIAAALQEGGESCGSHMVDVVLKENKEGIEGLSRMGKESFSFSAESIIPNSISNIKSIEAAQKDVVSMVNGECDQIRASVESQKKEVDSLTEKQQQLSDTLSNRTSQQEKTHIEVANSHRTHIDSTKESVIRSAEKQKQQLVAKLTESGTHAMLAKDQTSDFTANVIHAEDEVEAVPERQAPEFSEQLSSTPSEEVLLQSISNGKDHSEGEESSETDTHDHREESDIMDESTEHTDVLQECPLEDEGKENVPKEHKLTVSKRARGRARKEPKSKRIKTRK